LRRSGRRQADLKAGESIDGIGGFCTYGLIENGTTARGMAALPIGLSDGCTLRRKLLKDSVLSFENVEAHWDPLIESLRPVIANGKLMPP
jgi:predicted homoserine dehydrogenase-like protein